MLNMQNEIYAMMSKNFRTSKEYAGMYMDTIYGYNGVDFKKTQKDAVLTEEVAKMLDTERLIKESDKIAKQTHMAENPIYNFEYSHSLKESENHSKTRKETSKETKNNLEEEENVNAF